MTSQATHQRTDPTSDLPASTMGPDPAPGKQSTAASLPAEGTARATATPAAPGGPLPPELLEHVGETFIDGGHYVWRIEPDGSFVCVAQPPSVTKSSVGAKVKSTNASLWQALCGMAIDALAPEARTEPTAGDDAAAPPSDSGFSLPGFLGSLVGAGGALVDVGSQVADLVTGVVDTVTGAIGSLFGFGGDGEVTEVAPEEAEESGGGGGGGSDTGPDNIEDPETEPAAPPAPTNPATPHLVGGYPSSVPASDAKPNYSGAVSTEDAGIPRRHSGVKLTPPLVRTARILAEYVPAGTLITSGWRRDEDQAYIIWDYAGRASGKGEHKGLLVDGDLWKTKPKAEEYNHPIAWVGASDHRCGLAMDLGGASLSAIQAAVEKCKAERPDAKIVYVLPEPKCIHVQVVE